MGDRIRIIDQWQEYERKSLAPSAGLVQRRDLRRAYYAGAFAIMQHMTAVGRSTLTEEEAAALIEGIVDEINDFIGKVKGGRA